MAFTGKDVPETTDQQDVAILRALTWERPTEKTHGPRLWATRTFIYPRQISDMMELMKVGRQNILPVELEQMGDKMAALCGVGARNVDLKLYDYEQRPKLIVLSHSESDIPRMQLLDI
jgi:hypothetical protein